ncbi:MAG: ATP-grasp domain-containing protein [Planctomycetota bacterium]
MPARVLLVVPTSTYRAEDFIATARALNVAVTVASEELSSVAALNPADLIVIDFRDRARARTQALAFHARHPITAVVGVDDRAAPVAGWIADALGLPHHSVAAIEAARNKHKLRVRLAAHGVAQPAYSLLRGSDDANAAARTTTFPCVVKPLERSASQGVLRANDAVEFVAAVACVRALLARDDDKSGGAEVRTAADLLVEEFVPGVEVAVEGLVRDGVLEVLAIFDKPDPLDGPTFAETIYVTPSRLAAELQARIRAATARAVAARELADGPVHAELRCDGERLWCIEIAPRSIGGLCSRVLRFGLGVSLEELIIRNALRLALPAHERESQAAGVMMLPVPRNGVLRAVHGVDRARAAPHIVDVRITAHTGQVVEALPEGALYLGFIFARAPTSAAVEAALRTATAMLEVVIEERTS